MNSIKYPSYWRKVRLKDVCESTNQKTNDSRLPYIGLENIEGFSGRLISQFNNEDDSIIECTSNEFQEGDVLFGKLRPYLAKCWLATFRGRCSLELLVLRAKGANNRFLKYLLLSPRYLNTINNSTYGTKMPRANWSFIGNILSFLPPIEEQNVIAEYLDREAARIDGIIERLRAQSEHYEQLKRSLITETITQGLPHHNPSTFRRLRLKDVVSNHFSGDWGSDAESASEEDVEAICVRIADFEYNKGVVRLDKDASTARYYKPIILKEKKLRVNDLLVEKSGGGEKTPVGRVVIYPHQTDEPIMCANFMNVLRTNNFVSPHWLLFYMKRVYHLGEVLPMIKQNTGLQNLSLKDFMNMSISLPSLDVQEEIVAYLDERCSKIDQLSEKISRKIELLEQLKKSLIEEVVTGQRPVKNK